MLKEGRKDIETRFKKGRSGNPGGRPKGKKNSSTLLRDILFKQVSVTDSQGVRKISKFEAAAEVCLNNAIKGDLRSFTKIMELATELELVKPASDIPEIIHITRTIVDPRAANTSDLEAAQG